MKKALSILIFIFLVGNIYSQKKTKTEKLCYFNLHFLKNDTVYKENRSYLDSTYSNCMKDLISNHKLFILSPFSSKEELKTDKYIGLKRCLKIIEFFKSEYNLPETTFYIKHSTDISDLTNISLEKGGRVSCQSQ